MVRVAFVTPGAFPVPSPRGGSVERVVEKTVPRIAQAVPGVEARIYARIGRGQKAQGTIGGVRIERVPAASKRRYREQVMRRLRDFRPHIIQIENRPLWVPMFKRRFPRARIWLNLHSTTFITPPYANPAKVGRCLRMADRVLVNSRFLRRFILNRHGRSITVSVVYPGVESDRFAGRDREAERARRGWKGRRIALYVGRLIPKKGVHHLMECLPDWSRKIPGFLLIIVGSAFYGSHRKTAYVRRLHRKALPWRRHVHFEPYVSHTRIPSWYAMADVVVVPSAGREAFGLVNAEAMAAGVPIVATRAGGIPEIVANGRTGFLVDASRPVPGLKEKVQKLLTDDALRREMGERGRERVRKRFTWERTAAMWLEALKKEQGSGAIP
jgi:spore coat protein SA